LLFLAVAAATCLAAGCSKVEPGAKAFALVIGVNDPLCRETASACVGDRARRDYSALEAELKKSLGAPVTFRYYKFEQQLEAAIKSGAVNAAIGKAWNILRGAHDGRRDFERVADLPDADGRQLFSGVFVVRAESPIRKLEDLRGKTLALGSDVGYERSYQVRWALKHAGVEPAKIETLDSCLAVAAAVWEGKVDAGVMSDYAAEFGALEQVAGRSNALRVFARTAGVPFVTVAVSKDVDPALRAKLKSTLLSLTERKTPAGLETSGFVEPLPWTPVELEER
jgi:ABC-type phosphate/phosphonate transport system substrate-binding protein